MRSDIGGDDGLLELRLARDFASAWSVYWEIWEAPSEWIPGRADEVAAHAVALARSVDHAFSVCDEDDDDTIAALAALTLLTNELLLFGFAGTERLSFVRPSRPLLTEWLLRGGVADWCLRLGAPLRDEGGKVITFGDGPLPGIRKNASLEFVVAYGALGAEFAADDARLDFSSAVADAAPICRDILERLATAKRLPDASRRHLETTGIALLRTVLVTGAPILTDFGRGDASAEFFAFSEALFLMSEVARSLIVVATAASVDDLDSLALFDSEDIAELEHLTRLFR